MLELGVPVPVYSLDEVVVGSGLWVTNQGGKKFVPLGVGVLLLAAADPALAEEGTAEGVLALLGGTPEALLGLEGEAAAEPCEV